MDVGLAEIAEVAGVALILGGLLAILFSPELSHALGLLGVYVDNFNGKV